jgi:hypothetical protein
VTPVSEMNKVKFFGTDNEDEGEDEDEDFRVSEEEYLESVRRGREKLTPELLAAVQFEMAMPSMFYEKPPAEREALWQRFLALRDQIGADAAALMIRFELANSL